MSWNHRSVRERSHIPPPDPWPDGAGTVYHGAELTCPLPGFGLSKRNAGPITDRTAQDFLRLLVQHHLVHGLPLLDIGAPLIRCHIRELLYALGAHQRHKHLLALSMGLTLHQPHTAFVLQ